MKWTVVVSTILIIVFIVYLKVINILGDLEAVVLAIVSAILPFIIAYYLQPTVILKIKNPRFIREQENQVVGYHLEATVLNEGKRIGLNIDAYFDIRDSVGKPPLLLDVTTEEAYGQKTVKAEEEPFREDIGYAWTTDKKLFQGVLKELRHNDKVKLLFPYRALCVLSFSSKYLLKLEVDKDYEVKISVKGEDSEKNTVEATKKEKLKVKA